MQCPACGTALKQVRYHEILLEVCPECRGVWFDPGEMQGYINWLLADRDDIPDAKSNLFGHPVAVENVREDTRQCPKCREDMLKFNYSYDSNVILDRCPSCSGVWADGKEILQLAIYTKGNPRVDALAASVADHVQEQERFRDLAEGVSGLAAYPMAALVLPQIILPLRDDLARRTIPVVTMALIVLNVGILAFSMWQVPDLEAFYGEYGTVPADVAAGQNLWTLVSHMFLHGGILHLIGNMLFLWIFGDNVEDEFGHLLFVPFYFACGVGAALVHIAMNADSTIPCVGASGAISGILAAYFVFHPQATVRTFVIYRVVGIPAVLYIGLWFFVNVGYGFAFNAAGVQSGVAWFAHIGGFLCGAALAWPYKLFVHRPATT